MQAALSEVAMPAAIVIEPSRLCQQGPDGWTQQVQSNMSKSKGGKERGDMDKTDERTWITRVSRGQNHFQHSKPPKGGEVSIVYGVKWTKK